MKAVAVALALSSFSALSFSQGAPGETLLFQGTLVDTAFAGSGEIRAQVLESGDTARVTLGKAFVLPLPRDTLWHLCFRAQYQNPEESLEKCYAVSYSGPDSTFSRVLGPQGAEEIAMPAVAMDSGAASPEESASEEAGAVPEVAQEPETSLEAVQLRKVLVRAQRAPKRSLGKSTVSAKLIKRMPGLAEADVIRSIQGLPGVVTSSDFSTKIYVRGGGADQNLILLDEAPVYSPVHFFGLFSTFLVEGIDDVTFHKGGFPPQYGNRLSSVLDIKSRKGGKDTVDTWFQGSSLKISTFASQAHTEGKHSGSGIRWLLAGRSTYIKQVLDGLRAAGITDLDLDYYFYDVQGNVAYEGLPGHTFLLTGYNGFDRLDFTPFVVDWGNTVIPLNWSARLSPALESRATLSYSDFKQFFGLENIFELRNRITSASYKHVLEWSGLDGHRLTGGFDIGRFFTLFEQVQLLTQPPLRFTDNDDFWLSSLFLQDKWSIGDFDFTYGARGNYFSLLEGTDYALGGEPRLSIRYKLPYNQNLDFHTGYYLQYVNSILWGDFETLNEFYYPSQYDAKFDKTVKPTASVLFSAGYLKDRLFGQYDLGVEGYFKTLDHLLIFAPNETPDSVLFRTDRGLAPLFKEGEGYSYGYELSVRRPDGLLFGGISYSRGVSVMKEQFDSVVYYPKWHQAHSFKADLAINWRGQDGIWPGKKRGRYFRSSSQIKYATGLPFTEYVGYSSSHLLDQNPGRQAGGPVPEFNENVNVLLGQRNGAFVPPYFRWDVKAIDWGREEKWNLSLTLLNITNHENIFFYTYDRQKNPPELVKITQFPFFPLLVNYEYYF